METKNEVKENITAKPEERSDEQIPAVMRSDWSGSMTIIRDDGSIRHHRCPSRYCKSKFEHIQEYYSELHATKNGWKKTSDIKFCPPDIDYVWVCPDCASEYQRR